MTYGEAVKEVYFWQYSRTNCFNQLLLDLFGKADINNFNKLAQAFPSLASAYLHWQGSGDYGNDLFRIYGLMT